MARKSYNLLELDVDKLFEEHKIEEIVEIEKLLDAEIERKRIELRSMVGDRYKDVLAASDAIKNMKAISQGIVDNIQRITDTCQDLIVNTTEKDAKQAPAVEREKIEERMFVMQIRLAIFMNEEIWMALDNGDNLTAAQLYLLAQHIHIGLSISRKEYLDRLPLLQQINSNLSALKTQIYSRIKDKLESVEITAEESSSNLNALLLLQSHGTQALLSIFISHRKTALVTVINSSHPSVRVQISAMVKCLITTIHLLHDCFTSYENSGKGLISQQLEDILGETSPPTLSKVRLPQTPLAEYIPDIIRRFRPKCEIEPLNQLKETNFLEDWLQSTKAAIRSGLDNSFKLVTSVKGLHIIREEALKIELPADWDIICSATGLPDNFDVWYYFFQSLMTARSRELVTKKMSSITEDIHSDVKVTLSVNAEFQQTERDVRWSVWVEDSEDVSRIKNKHIGLSMKTLGYSKNVVGLCEKLDAKYLELLVDVSQYLYGKEFEECVGPRLDLVNPKAKRKFVDRGELEKHLRAECGKNSMVLTKFLQDFVKEESIPELFLLSSLTCARFLQASTVLCPHFARCCSFNGATEEFNKICTHFTSTSLEFWRNWVHSCVQSTGSETEKQFSSIGACSMISILPRWDVIEIQEQTEEKVFKSQIKVPLKPSLALQNVLVKLNDDISAVLAHTLPKQIHLQFIQDSSEEVLKQYQKLAEKELNQNQALQFLFDVKFLTAFCISRENVKLVSLSQEICDRLRARIDPFDLDVFYSHLQGNVKRAVGQSQVIFGCLLPSTAQVANLGLLEKATKDQEKEPSILLMSTPSSTSWFPLLPISTPSQKSVSSMAVSNENKGASPKSSKTTPKKSQDPTAVMRSSAAALFGNLTTDWFS